MRIDGKCHCGNIAFRLNWPGEATSIAARACGCGFCIKHGGVWTSNPAAASRVSVSGRAAVSEYEFGTKTATFHVCARCGAVPFVSSRIGDRLYAVVNVNAFEGVDPTTIVRTGSNFDGEAVQDRLARRARNWIGDVRVGDFV